MEILEEHLETIPIGAEYVGTFTAQQTLGIDFPESKGIGYLTSPITVFKSETQSGERFDALISHPPIDGRGLHSVLATTAPYKQYADSVGGVVADWDVVDRANSARSNNYNDGYSQRLVSLHEHLGSAWHDFMTSRPAFLELFVDVQEQYFGQPAEKQLVPAHLVHRSAHLDNLVRQASHSLDTMVGLLEESGLESAHQFVYNAIKAEVNRKRPPSYPINREEKVIRRFNSWGEMRRRDFMAKLFSKVDPSTQLEVIDRKIPTKNATS